ncbi:hypothetical protein TIFTF001_009988 [Ficus carica]|uniref:Protein kinase domain-containing protein n=1 Tax=Ficus carica TaxID=3494 RepID=A0AA87ZW93_FICCA|nr:hypothetical protein TIFTF001_009988 [Ficus carica]
MMKRIREEDQLQVKRNKIGEQGQSIYADSGGKDWIRGQMLGKGGFGSVHMAFLKVGYGPEFEGCPTIMAVKSATEISAYNHLKMEKILLERFSDSPYIIRCFGDDITLTDDSQLVYNVFLELACGSLIDLIKRAKEKGGVLKESSVRLHTVSILNGLKRIHEEGFVHCDLKLENILLVRQGKANGGDTFFVAKIADLGLTKRVGTKSVGGTRSYWSPEIIKDNIQEQPSDIWALGCIVFEMLTGKLPWRHDCTGIGDEEVKDLLHGLSTLAKDFLKWCFMRNPSDRPTAKMLLKHPFLCRLIHKNKEDDRQNMFSSTSFSDDEVDDEDSSVDSLIISSSSTSD